MLFNPDTETSSGMRKSASLRAVIQYKNYSLFRVIMSNKGYEICTKIVKYAMIRLHESHMGN